MTTAPDSENRDTLITGDELARMPDHDLTELIDGRSRARVGRGDSVARKTGYRSEGDRVPGDRCPGGPDRGPDEWNDFRPSAE